MYSKGHDPLCQGTKLGQRKVWGLPIYPVLETADFVQVMSLQGHVLTINLTLICLLVQHLINITSEWTTAPYKKET